MAPYMRPVPDRFLSPEVAKKQREEYARLYKSQAKMTLAMGIITVIFCILAVVAIYYIRN